MKRKNGLIAAVLVAIIAISGCGEITTENNIEQVEVKETDMVESQETPRAIVEKFSAAMVTDSSEDLRDFVSEGLVTGERLDKLNTMNLYDNMEQTMFDVVISIVPDMSYEYVNTTTENVMKKFSEKLSYSILSEKKLPNESESYEFSVEITLPHEFGEFSNMSNSMELFYSKLGISSDEEFMQELMKRSGKTIAELYDMGSSEISALSVSLFEAEWSEIIEEIVDEIIKTTTTTNKVFTFSVHKEGDSWKIYDISTEASTEVANTGNKINLDNYSIGTYYIKENELNGFSQKDVRTLLNALYAYHGYTFTSDEYKNLFSEKSWYNPSNKTMEECEAEFNDYERVNKDTIAAFEKSKGWR